MIMIIIATILMNHCNTRPFNNVTTSVAIFLFLFHVFNERRKIAFNQFECCQADAFIFHSFNELPMRLIVYLFLFVNFTQLTKFVDAHYLIRFEIICSYKCIINVYVFSYVSFHIHRIEKAFSIRLFS